MPLLPLPTHRPVFSERRQNFFTSEKSHRSRRIIACPGAGRSFSSQSSANSHLRLAYHGVLTMNPFPFLVNLIPRSLSWKRDIASFICLTRGPRLKRVVHPTDPVTLNVQISEIVVGPLAQIGIELIEGRSGVEALPFAALPQRPGTERMDSPRAGLNSEPP